MIKTDQAHKPRTATPDKYPQGYFKEKDCRRCGTTFQPISPSHLFCDKTCAAEAQAERYYQRNYGIGLEDWRRLHQEQEGLCAICRGEGFTMGRDHVSKLMVDHCHSTGDVRGLLCHNCNRALGLLQEEPENIKRALEYLERATTIPKGSRPKRVEAHSPR